MKTASIDNDKLREEVTNLESDRIRQSEDLVSLNNSCEELQEQLKVIHFELLSALF